jgi:hypothetical protein
MKKYSWIVALLALTVAFAFVACDDGDSSKKKDPPALPDKVIEAADITLYAVGDSKKPTVTGNKVKYDGTAKGVTGSGFAYDFPADVIGAGYQGLKVELELLAITSPDFVSFNAKDSTKIDKDVLIVGHTQQYHNELKIGTIVDKADGVACSADCLKYTAGTCIVGATGSAVYPMSKLTNGVIAFQYNPWAGDIGASFPKFDTDGEPDFEIAVTKITFIGTGVEEVEPPPPAGPSAFDLAALKAVAGGITLTVGGSDGAEKISFDATDKFITLAGGTSSIFYFAFIADAGLSANPTTGTVKITYACAAEAGEPKLTVKDNVNSWSDLGGGATNADKYPTLETGTDKVLSIPVAYLASGATGITFQNNGGADSKFYVKILSVTVVVD